MAKKPKAMGRGLGTILPDADFANMINTMANHSATDDENSQLVTAGIANISLDKIETNPYQPRKEFDETALNELAQSLKQQGVISPITVRKMNDDRYQLIAGERRFRAAKIANLTEIPAYIRVATDAQVMEMALVENIQREDLNSIEIALTYQRLLDEYQFTQEKLSERVGKKRATVANYLRLLKLPAEIQLGLTKKEIDMGHARALINVSDPALMIQLYEDIVKNGYSVRKVEELVKNLSVAKPAKKQADPEIKAEYEQMSKHLSNLFGASVKIERNDKGKGRIVLQFANDDELEKLLATMDQIRQNA